MHNHKNNRGFTLVEMMVTIAIVGIFASLALPSFARLIESNRINSATNELMSNLLLARSEALKRRNTVTMCASADQISCLTGTDSEDYSKGWIIFLDCGAIGVQNGGTIPNCGTNNQEEIIKVGDGFEPAVLTNTHSNNKTVTFGFSGRAENGLTTFDIQNDAGTVTKNVIVNMVGRVRTQ